MVRAKLPGKARSTAEKRSRTRKVVTAAVWIAAGAVMLIPVRVLPGILSSCLGTDEYSAGEFFGLALMKKMKEHKR